MAVPREKQSGVPDPPGPGDPRHCAFCKELLTAKTAKQFRNELICNECVAVVAAAQRTPKPATSIADRAAAIDTAAIAMNRLAMGVVLSLLSVGGVVIGAILVGHATEDTWELDNAAKIHTLAAEANRLDTTDQRAALSKYEELNRLVGKRQVHDPELKQVVETAKNRCGELESKLAAELAREREEARQREQSKRDKRRRDELEQQQKEEARQRELAQWQEQERREKEARDKPIDISDIGVKLVDTTPSLDLCTYSWKATVTNRTASPVSLSVILTLYDEEGYELESDYKFGVIIGGQKNEVVTGQGMTKLSTFNRAAKYGVSVR